MLWKLDQGSLFWGGDHGVGKDADRETTEIRASPRPGKSTEGHSRRKERGLKLASEGELEMSGRVLK